MRRIHAVTIAVLVAALTLSACANTIRGAGRDIKQSVDAVDDSLS